MKYPKFTDYNLSFVNTYFRLPVRLKTTKKRNAFFTGHLEDSDLIDCIVYYKFGPISKHAFLKESSLKRKRFLIFKDYTLL